MAPIPENTISLHGQLLSPAELRRRTGRIGQVAGIESFTYNDGPERGVRALRVRTGTGFAFTVLADRGLDIGDAEFRGMALAWSSPVGVAGPWYYEPEGAGWLRSFHGGLVATCGLQHAGRPSERDGNPVGMHGRASNLPAAQITHEAHWNKAGCTLEVRGQVREASVFGSNLLLTRRITARIGESGLLIEDTVENQGWSPAPLMLLYHINLGWPLLSETSRLVGPGAAGDVPEPHDPDVHGVDETWNQFTPPTLGFTERTCYHDPLADADGWAEARLENPQLEGGVTLRVRFRPAELPEFAQWTMTGEGTYVLGLEPATCRLKGYPAEREAGRVIDLQPGECRRFTLGIAVESTHR